MQAGTVLTPTALILSGLLVLAGVLSDTRPAFAQTPLECPLPTGVTPPAPPRVTAQQVEAGRASLMDFTLVARDQRASESQGGATPEAAYTRCLIRQEGSPWRSGSTYLIDMNLRAYGRVLLHAKNMALSGALLKPVIYHAILHALGINPADLTDPAAARPAIAAATARDGGPFDVPGSPGASGYATAYVHPLSGRPRVLLVGFDLDSSHLVEEDIVHIEPAITARDVVDRATLKAFVTAAGEHFASLLESGTAWQAQLAFRDPNGPWRHGPVYVAIMARATKLIMFHGGFPDRFEQRYGGIATDIATGERVVDQLVRAAESGPDGGFWEYYFDNPADDTDNAEVPKVGYARIVTANFPQPDGSTKSLDLIVNSGFYLDAEGLGDLGGRLENPGPHAFQSGIGALWGWVCEAEQVEIEIATEQGEFAWHMAAYGLERGDTLDTCGDTDNGFVLLLNWNLLGDGQHTVTALADGVELGRTTVRVTTLGQEFVEGAVGECVAEDFPQSGQSTLLEWRRTVRTS